MREPGCILQAGAHSSNGWDVETPWHHHDMHQLLYAFEGSVEVEGRLGRYRVPHQFAAWIPAGAVHRTTIQQVPSGSVFFAPAMAPCAETAPRVIPAPRLMREMVMHAMRWPLDREDDTASAVYFTCLANLCQEWIQGDVRLVLPSSTDPAIRAIMDFTEANLAGVTVADVCRRAAVSERTLRRRFRGEAGITWEEFRQRLRLHLALDQLEQTDRQVGAIAADLGYESQAAFAKMFRSVIGASPTAYRASRAGRSRGP
jgi:AraC-like DNA-binding protein